MPYRELQYTVVAELAEPLGDALIELGALSISVEDASARSEEHTSELQSH